MMNPWENLLELRRAATNSSSILFHGEKYGIEPRKNWLKTKIWYQVISLCCEC